MLTAEAHEEYLWKLRHALRFRFPLKRLWLDWIAKRLRTIAEIEKQREDTGELVRMSLEEWDAICEELSKEKDTNETK